SRSDTGRNCVLRSPACVLNRIALIVQYCMPSFMRRKLCDVPFKHAQVLVGLLVRQPNVPSSNSGLTTYSADEAALAGGVASIGKLTTRATSSMLIVPARLWRRLRVCIFPFRERPEVDHETVSNLPAILP